MSTAESRIRPLTCTEGGQSCRTPPRNYKTKRPSVLNPPPASAAQIYVNPADGNAEQTSSMTVAVIKLKTIENKIGGPVTS
jgi:hypothetical protein